MLHLDFIQYSARWMCLFSATRHTAMDTQTDFTGIRKTRTVKLVIPVLSCAMYRFSYTAHRCSRKENTSLGIWTLYLNYYLSFVGVLEKSGISFCVYVKISKVFNKRLTDGCWKLFGTTYKLGIYQIREDNYCKRARCSTFSTIYTIKSIFVKTSTHTSNNIKWIFYMVG